MTVKDAEKYLIDMANTFEKVGNEDANSDDSAVFKESAERIRMCVDVFMKEIERLKGESKEEA